MKLHISDEIVFRDLAGEAVILNLATGLYFSLDEVGTRAWQLLVESGCMETTIKALLTEFEVEEVILRQDVGELVQQCIQEGLVTRDVKDSPSARCSLFP